MFRGKQNTFARSSIALTAVFLVVSLALIAGTAWGRYRDEVYGDITLQSRQATGVYLYGGKDESGYTQLTDHWQVSADGGSSLPLLVSNTDGTFVPQRDVSFSLRLAATQGIGAGENWSVSLHVTGADGSISVYPGVAQAIIDNTELHDQFGDGWIYWFYNTDGHEAEFTLPGNAPSEWRGAVVCNQTTTDSAPALLQLQIIARDN